MEDIEKGKGSVVIEGIKPQFNRYVGRHFENIAMEILDILNEKGLLPFRFTRIGKWWHKEQEIDIVAFNETSKQAIFCECKWSDKVNAREVLKHLKEKASRVPLQREEEYYIIFAKGFKKKITEDNVILYDLNDLEHLLL
jgi:uncharacterized protein